MQQSDIYRSLYGQTFNGKNYLRKDFSSISRLTSKDVRQGLKFAYDKKNKTGYHIGDIDGVNVMYIRGSRNLWDHTKNFWDEYGPEFQPITASQVRYYDDVARKNNVAMVIGHSRGGYIAGRMRYGKLNRKVFYVGLDSAQRLQRDEVGKRLFNLHQNNRFDRFLASKGKNNFEIKQGRKWHAVYEP